MSHWLLICLLIMTLYDLTANHDRAYAWKASYHRGNSEAVRAETRVAGLADTAHISISSFPQFLIPHFPFLVLGQPLGTGLICCLFTQSHADHVIGPQDEGSFMKAQVTAALVKGRSCLFSLTRQFYRYYSRMKESCKQTGVQRAR